MAAAMIDRETLLADLQRLVQFLKADLLERSREVSEVEAGLRTAHQAIASGKRTAQAFEEWRDDYLEQVAVAWVLACVFVRYMEDNGLIAETYLAGTGDRRRQAEDAHEAYFRAHPHDSDREYLLDVFRKVGSIPAARDLFAEGKTPVWAVGPSGDGAARLLAFWREIDPAVGGIRRSLHVEGADTRFLGDLYQHLSQAAQEKYALKQTPDFVEEFILDHTLTPALDEFGLETVRLIDPTCGSGHFLLGAFRRLFRLWSEREPGTEPTVLAQRALEAVYGVDVNPFAVAIARFRLVVEAMHLCDVHGLNKAPGWTVHVAFGDSLMHGDRFDQRGFRQPWLPGDEPWSDPVYALEDPIGLHAILDRQYHAVVGNPPYKPVKDSTLSGRYRARWATCHRQYSLGVPFTERFFDLALAADNGRPAGFVGMITANSFMKREFGKKLIEKFLPEVDLTHIIDTSGAYIPDHVTTTVILFGRNRRPVADVVRAVLGIRGEPTTPDEPAQGRVWRSIVDYLGKEQAQNEYVTVTDVTRATLRRHPWSIGGGGAADLKTLIEETSEKTLRDYALAIGRTSVVGEDDAWILDAATAARLKVSSHCVEFAIGEFVRDWSADALPLVIYPYEKLGGKPICEESDLVTFHLWTYRSVLNNRTVFGKSLADQGRPWYEHLEHYTDKLKGSFAITFAFVATHNHFVLDRGGKVFKQSAPIIKLPAGATEDDHLALLGLLNSSTACFWMKQIFYPKSTAVGDISTDKGKPEANRYEFAGTGLHSFPIHVADGSTAGKILGIAKCLDQLARRTCSLMPKVILNRWSQISARESLTDLLAIASAEYEKAKRRMIALQEELDWEVYQAYALCDEGSSKLIIDDDETGIGASVRPYLWECDVAPDGVPEEWQPVYEQRKLLIESEPNLKLIEDPVFKRPWWGRQGVYGGTSRTYKEWIKDALQAWLLDRLESGRYWPDPSQTLPELTSAHALAERAQHDSDFLHVATLYAGRPDFPLPRLVEELITSESVPFLPVLRYKPSGLTKRQVWERTWDLQRREDAREDVGPIPVPPKYTSADFVSSDIWRLRGKLDVPKERFVSYPHCSRDGDPSHVVGWAGWDHRQHATAIAAYYDRMKTREGWPAERLVPLLAGLDQLVFWLKLWHNEVDPDYDLRMGDYYADFVRDEAQILGYTLDQVRNWTPSAKAKGGRGKKASRRVKGDAPS